MPPRYARPGLIARDAVPDLDPALVQSFRNTLVTKNKDLVFSELLKTQYLEWVVDEVEEKETTRNVMHLAWFRYDPETLKEGVVRQPCNPPERVRPFDPKSKKNSFSIVGVMPFHSVRWCSLDPTALNKYVNSDKDWANMSFCYTGPDDKRFIPSIDGEAEEVIEYLNKLFNVDRFEFMAKNARKLRGLLSDDIRDEVAPEFEYKKVLAELHRAAKNKGSDCYNYKDMRKTHSKRFMVYDWNRIREREKDEKERAERGDTSVVKYAIKPVDQDILNSLKAFYTRRGGDSAKAELAVIAAWQMRFERSMNIANRMLTFDPLFFSDYNGDEMPLTSSLKHFNPGGAIGAVKFVIGPVAVKKPEGMGKMFVNFKCQPQAISWIADGHPYENRDNIGSNYGDIKDKAVGAKLAALPMAEGDKEDDEEDDGLDDAAFLAAAEAAESAPAPAPAPAPASGPASAPASAPGPASGPGPAPGSTSALDPASSYSRTTPMDKDAPPYTNGAAAKANGDDDDDDDDPTMPPVRTKTATVPVVENDDDDDDTVISPDKRKSKGTGRNAASAKKRRIKGTVPKQRKKPTSAEMIVDDDDDDGAAADY